jgi:2'-5' RNA ligase
MAKDKMYFIALLPPDTISDEITAFKKDIEHNYNSKSALRTMPHITLKAPFKLPADEHGKVTDWFNNLKPNVAAFTVHINGFGAFPNKHNPVIFVHPELSESLARLQAALIQEFETAFPNIRLSTHEYTFSPHMTIGYRDLSAENFEKAWHVYKDREYKTHFTAKSIVLLQHNGMKWEVIEEVSLQSQSQ